MKSRFTTKGSKGTKKDILVFPFVPFVPFVVKKCSAR